MRTSPKWIWVVAIIDQRGLVLAARQYSDISIEPAAAEPLDETSGVTGDAHRPFDLPSLEAATGTLAAVVAARGPGMRKPTKKLELPRPRASDGKDA